MAQGDTNRERRTASGLVIPVDINDAPAEFFSAEVNAQDALAYLVHIADELHRRDGHQSDCVWHWRARWQRGFV